MRLLNFLFLLEFALTPLLATAEDSARLRVQNDFDSPVQVVEYYLNRDAAGFIWSGMLDIERKEFTLWSFAPSKESYFVAKKAEIIPMRTLASLPNTQQKQRAQIQVQYEIAGMMDAQGNFTPPSETQKPVTFELVQIDGKWKISSPSPEQIDPIVLKSKFPYSKKP